MFEEPLVLTQPALNGAFVSPPSSPPRSSSSSSTPQQHSPSEHALFIHFKKGDLIYGTQDERNFFILQRSKLGLNVNDNEATTIDQMNSVFYGFYAIILPFQKLQSIKSLADYNIVFSIKDLSTAPEKQTKPLLPIPTFSKAQPPIEQAGKFLVFLLTLSKYSPLKTGGKSSHKKLSEEARNEDAKIRRSCKAGILYAMEETRKHPGTPMTIHFLMKNLSLERVVSKQHQDKEDFAFTGSELRFIFRLYKLSQINPGDFATQGTEEYKKLQAIVEFCEPIKKCVKFYNANGFLQTTFPGENSSPWNQYKPKVLENPASLLKFYDMFVKKPSMPSVSHTLTSGAGLFSHTQQNKSSELLTQSRKRKQRPM